VFEMTRNASALPTWAAAIAAWADTGPEARALIASEQDQGFDYAALTAHITETGRRLAGHGCQPDGAILVETGQGPRSAARLLGVGAFCPAAPFSDALTLAAFEAMAQRLQPQAVFVADPDSRFVPWAESLGLRIIGAESDSLPPQGNSLPLSALSDIAVILETSGTTGVPKAVGLTHGQFAFVAAAVTQAFGLTRRDRVLNPNALFHAHGLSIGLVAPLFSGGAVALPTDTSIEAALTLGATAGVSWITAVPTRLNAMVTAVSRHEALAKALRLRFIRSASSPLHLRLRADLERVFRCPVLEGYAMTEACSFITQQVPEDHPALVRPGQVGRPQGAMVRINPLADTADTGNDGAGEVLIRGPQVISAYLAGSRPAEAFEGEWLRTGDIGTLDPDGSLRLLARKSELIDQGGVMIAPAEIEDALLSLPGVAQALAFAVPHDTLGQAAIALVVAVPDSTPDEAGLRDRLVEVLPPEKIPLKTMVVAAIPQGATGKPDRSIAARMQTKGAPLEPEPPKDAMEHVVRDMMAHVLPGHRRLGRHEDFFLSGGDSLSAAALAAHARELLEIDLPMDTLFHYPTVMALAEFLKTAEGGRAMALIVAMSDELARGGEYTDV
jgi:oxalate---CoA ligase